MTGEPMSRKLAGFVRSVGIPVRFEALPDPTFLPGFDIRFGTLVIDEARLLYPGDILHEAGHIAVSDPAEREQERLDPSPGDEMATIAWSYAAACHLGIPLEVLFHPDGYKGDAEALIENFSTGHYLGVPLLQLYGLTVEPHRAAEEGADPYPHMTGWLRS
ncbi:hypothetical protein [Breoghania sp. JC706]|uniref:hypothetical protein n=1 Tax=Breoghania sp. JC706 TaxID=3117732 RepID=UPI0030081AE7